MDVAHMCRICLQNNAHISIFNTDGKTDTLLAKLSFCLRENIEDIDGYPKNICTQCSDTLDESCAFIKRFQESCRILSDGIFKAKPLKLEIAEYYSEQGNDGYASEVEIYYTDNFKPEPEDSNNEQITKPVKFKQKKKVKSSKKTGSTLITQSLTERKNRQETNIIASSILEGCFVWNGETWSISASKPGSQASIIKAVKKPLKKPVNKKIKKEKFNGEQKILKKLCDICGKELKNSDRLRDHMKRVHLATKYPCTVCSKACNTKNDLNRHMKSKHSTEKNFVCAVCGKRFPFKNILDRHMLTQHSKDYVKKMFSCSFCPKTYSCKKSVTIHERSVHTGLRPAVCSVCDSAFFHEEYLREHMRLHTGEAPFKCPVCSRGYAQRGNMKSHIRIHRVSEIDSNTLAKIKPNYIKLMKQ